MREREVSTSNVLAIGGGQGPALFDVAANGRVLMAEEVPGTFQLILVHNWLSGLAKQTAR